MDNIDLDNTFDLNSVLTPNSPFKLNSKYFTQQLNELPKTSENVLFNSNERNSGLQKHKRFNKTFNKNDANLSDLKKDYFEIENFKHNFFFK